MDIVKLKIPYDFLRERIQLTWRLVQFGWQNELVDSAVPKKFAIHQMAERDETAPELWEVADAPEGASISDPIRKLAESESYISPESVAQDWLYLVLAWIYEHKHQFSDPLKLVEEIYADFGYPESIEGFVRYMPMTGPDLGSPKANENRLFERWKQFVDQNSHAREVGIPQ